MRPSDILLLRGLKPTYHTTPRTPLTRLLHASDNVKGGVTVSEVACQHFAGCAQRDLVY
jgi:hypothetical protein